MNSFAQSFRCNAKANAALRLRGEKETKSVWKSPRCWFIRLTILAKIMNAGVLVMLQALGGRCSIQASNWRRCAYLLEAVWLAINQLAVNHFVSFSVVLIRSKHFLNACSVQSLK